MTNSKLGCRRGILLPTALLLVMGLMAAATSVLVLARAGLLLERGDLMYLQRRVTEEVGIQVGAWNESGSRDRKGSIGQEAYSQAVELAGGYILMRGAGSASRPATMAVHWRLDPDAVVAEMPAALELGVWPEEEGLIDGVHPYGVGCPSFHAEHLIAVRSDDTEIPADPAVSVPPRVGILGFDELLALPATELGAGRLSSPWIRPGFGAPGPAILRADAGARFESGEAEGVLVIPGDLAFLGAPHFRGLLIVAGDLYLAGHARIEGVVLVGGTVHLRDEAKIFGCKAFAADALNHPDLARVHPVRGGSRLGRF